MRKAAQSIDGVGVDLSRARFAGSFDVVEGDESALPYDEEIVYVVVATVSGSSFADKKGETVKVAVLTPKEARLLRDEKLKIAILEKLNFDYTPQPSVFDDSVDETDLDDRAETHELGPTEPEINGVRLLDAAIEEELIPLGEPDDIDEDDVSFREAMAILKATNAEFENEPEDFEPVQEGNRRIVGRTLGAAETDPVLAGFLGVTK